jgi:predicted RNA-binding Zn ribbon-like protein
MSSIADLQHVAGNLALDFVNTVEDRLGPDREDFLTGPAELAEWGALAGVLGDHARASEPRAELEAAMELREHLTAIFEAQIAGRPAGRRDLDALAQAVAAADTEGTLERGEDGLLGWCWDPAALASVRHRVAKAAYELLSGPAASRIGECAGPGCGWFFLDSTKRGNRRWCSMRDCGQEAKSARRRLSASAMS